MKNKSNIISSCVVALLAGVIYYILSEPGSFQKTVSDNTWEEGGNKKVTASTISGQAKGEGVDVEYSYKKVSGERKDTRKNIYRVSNRSKKYNKVQQHTVLADNRQKKNNDFVYASNTLGWTKNNFIIDNNSDMDVSVVNEGGETHIIIKSKTRKKSNNSNTGSNNDVVKGDMIRNECKIIIKDCDEEDSDGLKRTNGKLKSSTPGTDPITGQKKEEKFHFGTEDAIETK